MARRGSAPTVQVVAEAAAAKAVQAAIPAVLKAVARELAAAVEPAVVEAVQGAIRDAVQRAVAGVGGVAPAVSFGGAPVQPRPVQAPTARPENMDSPEGRAWLAAQLEASTPRVQNGERVPIRTGNLAVDRMLGGGIRQPMRDSDFQ